jgi:hypothetical protein
LIILTHVLPNSQSADILLNYFFHCFSSWVVLLQDFWALDASMLRDFANISWTTFISAARVCLAVVFTVISFAFFKTYCYCSACLCMILRKFGILHNLSFMHLNFVTKIRSTFFLWFEADQSYLEIDETVPTNCILIMHTSLLNYTQYDHGLYKDKFKSDKWCRLQVLDTSGEVFREPQAIICHSSRILQ